MKKKTILLALLLLSVLTANAQEERVRDKSVYLEFFGPSLGVGVSYDARFSKTSKWGYRAGFGFAYSHESSPFGNSSSRVYSIPLGVTYLFGNQKHNLELGAGVSVGINNDTHRVGEDVIVEPYNPKSQYTRTKLVEENKFLMFTYSSVGYRFTSKKGFQLRVGITPTIPLLNRDFFDAKVAFMPYISFGKAF